MCKLQLVRLPPSIRSAASSTHHANRPTRFVGSLFRFAQPLLPHGNTCDSNYISLYLVIHKLTPVMSKVTLVERKPTPVQHKLQLALRTSEPVVQMGEIVLQGHRSAQPTPQTDLQLLQLPMQTGQIVLLIRFLVMNGVYPGSVNIAIHNIIAPCSAHLINIKKT